MHGDRTSLPHTPSLPLSTPSLWPECQGWGGPGSGSRGGESRSCRVASHVLGPGVVCYTCLHLLPLLLLPSLPSPTNQSLLFTHLSTPCPSQCSQPLPQVSSNSSFSPFSVPIIPSPWLTPRSSPLLVAPHPPLLTSPQHPTPLQGSVPGVVSCPTPAPDPFLHHNLAKLSSIHAPPCPAPPCPGATAHSKISGLADGYCGFHLHVELEKERECSGAGWGTAGRGGWGGCRLRVVPAFPVLL